MSGMLLPATPPRALPAWQMELAQAIATPEELLACLDIAPGLAALGGGKLRDFPLRVPRGFVARMEKGNPFDPLFLQVWPRAEEAAEAPGFGADAVGDLAALKPGGIVHKYHGRALVIATGACGIHCRYCFRRHFPYAEANGSRGRWTQTLAAIAADPSIEEVILSGGDPLALSDDRLAALARGLEAIAHVRRLRIHSRQPVVLPERVDAALLAWLGASRLQKVLVLHVNHPNELDEAVGAACARLREAGVNLLNQSVLLRGINDCAEVLRLLSTRLFDFGVLPYYLHLLDRVEGSAHFEVAEATAIRLMRDVASRLPGYLVPRLARDPGDAPSKQVLTW